MELFTLQASKTKLAREHKIFVTDTTVRAKHPYFAPTWSIVMGHKDGEITDAEYTAEYYRQMQRSWAVNREQWENFLRQDGFVGISCYCRAGAFCHRHLLRKMFEKVCPKLGIPFFYYGEFE